MDMKKYNPKFTPKIISGKTILLNTVTNCTFIAGDLEEEVQIGSRENDKHIEWAGELDIKVIGDYELFNELYDRIKHGDDEHMEWLRNEINAFVKEKGLKK